METPDPGVYSGVPAADYFAWDAISNSSLREAKRSPLHYKSQQPVQPTDAMRLGSLIHAGKLEPHALLEEYAVLPEAEFVRRTVEANSCTERGAKRTTYYADLVAKWEEQNKGKVAISEAELADLRGVVLALASHSRSCEYFSGGEAEVAIVWHDKFTGLKCKARIDFWAKSAGRISDLKTTDDVSQFAYKIDAWDYHRQMAFYGDGLQTLGYPVVERCVVAVERNAPYGVAAAPISPTDICEGRREYGDLLVQIKLADMSGEWRGYEDPDEWERPAYKRTKRELILSDGEYCEL